MSSVEEQARLLPSYAPREGSEVAALKQEVERPKFAWTDLEDFSWTTTKALVAEFVASVLFLFINIMYLSARAARVEEGGYEPPRDFIGFNFGLTIFILVYVFGATSGGHINPAVTVACFISRRNISAIKSLLYILAQSLGATVGVAWAKVTNPHAFGLARGGVNAVSYDSGYTIAGALIGEIGLTFLLCTTVLAATDKNRGAKAGFQAPLVPLAIGFSIFLGHVALM
jgi:glycerol uptake facilitator-like aquaporin